MKKILTLLSSLALLSISAMGALPVHALTDEEFNASPEHNDNGTLVMEDGVIYTQGGDSLDEWSPGPGRVNYSYYTYELPRKYPDARYYVQIMLYLDGSSGAGATEVERLAGYGINLKMIPPPSGAEDILEVGYGILTGEQLLNFPISDKVGYITGLMRPDVEEILYKKYGPIVSGDTNRDGSVDLADVVMLNKHLMIGFEIDEKGLEAADVDKNGIVDEIDSLNILKSIIGLVDLNELG